MKLEIHDKIVAHLVLIQIVASNGDLELPWN